MHSAEPGFEADPLEHPQHSPRWLPCPQPSPGKALLVSQDAQEVMLVID